MENSLKGLILAAGIIITCIIISLGFYIAREASDTASTGAGQINELTAEFADASLTMYDGTSVSGSEVLNVLRKYDGETIGILVKNSSNSSGAAYNYTINFESGSVTRGELGSKTTANKYTDARNVQNTSVYINPTGRFAGNVVRNSNGSVIGLVFAQEEV